MTVDIIQPLVALTGDIGQRAAGGPVSAGSTYLVGERGPELLTMGNQGGNITPNSALLGGGINVSLVYSPSVSLGGEEEAREGEVLGPHPGREAEGGGALKRG